MVYVQLFWYSLGIMSQKQSQILSNTEEVIKCGNIDALERHIEEIQSSQASNRCAEVPNLIILACKHSRIVILKFLFMKNGTTIKPYDLDDSKHNAFYYAIRSGNMDLLKTLITDWPGSPFTNNLEKLDDILSQAYDELKLKNIPLSEETIMFVESQLIDLRFFSNNANSRQSSLTNIIKRIELVVGNIDLLSAEYSNDQEIDERFLFIAKCIAQNIFVLRRQLRSTYKTLPWEEIEFCLIRFTLAHIKQHKNNIFYHSILNTAKLLKYLNLFSKKLKEEQTNLNSIGIDFDVEKLAEKPKQIRQYIVEKIIQICPQFEDLYNDYQQIRDIHSLSKMSHYIELSLAVDPKEKEGKLVIKRTLMVIGEHTKNTLESPKLSKDTQFLLLFSLSSNTNKILKGLRDSLAHAHPNIDNTEDINVFIGIQKDFEQLRDLIDDVLYKIKVNIIKIILKEIANEENYDQIRKMSKIVLYWEDEIFKVSPRRNLDRIKHLFGKLIKSITHPTGFETNKIKEVDELFESEEFSLLINRLNNIDSYKKFVFLNQLEEYSKTVELLTKYKAQTLLDNISDEIYEVNLLRKIDSHCLRIFHSLTSRMETHTKEFDEIYKLILKIFFICSLGTNDVKSIKEFEKKFKEEQNMKSTQKKDKFPGYQLNDKLVDLRQDLIILLESTKRTENKSKFQAVVEELVFRMLTLFMVSKTCVLENNFLSIDDNSPLLIGTSLRNHLAHDNELVDLFTSDPLIPVVLNAKKFITEDFTSTDDRKRLGRTLPENLIRVTNNYQCGLEIISNQRKMFSALQNGNRDDFECCLTEGADVFGRCSRMGTALHYASMGGSLDIVEYLFDKNVLADAKDIHGNTVLHIASEYGRTDIVEYILENKKVCKDELTELKETALHLAAEKGHTRTVELLLDYKASVNIQNVRNLIPLQKAVIHNQKDVVEIFLKHEGKSRVNSLYLLHLASISSNLVMVEYLLTKGANVDAINNDKETPLHIAARYGNSLVVSFLIKNKAKVKPDGYYGRVPLHYAAYNGHVTVVETLIKYCAKINDVDVNKFTPLSYAIQNGHANVVDIILKNRSETDVADQPLLHLAVFSGNLKTINALLDSGVTINLRDHKGKLPIHLLAFTKHSNASEIAEVLIRSGIDINANDQSSNTLLHLASISGSTELMEYLVAHGADLNSRNSDSSTPLHFAVFKDNLEAVKILVINEALINEKDKRGFTPFLLAVDKGYTEIVEYFLENKVREDKDTEFKESALGRGISHGTIDLVKVLLKHKSQINNRGISDGLALLKAIHVGNKDVVKILIENGANFNPTKSGDVSPLCCAIKLNRMEIIKLLVSKGANVDGEGGQPIVDAVYRGFNDIVEYLLQKNASLNIAVMGANTNLLNLAVTRGHKDVVSTVIKYGANVNTTFSKGVTALHTSVSQGYNDITKILIENGADVNAKSDCGTPLQIAVEKNNLECVKSFINSGKACMENKFKNDYTILHIAAEQGNIEMVEYLVNNGSDINAKLSNDANGSKALHIAAAHGFKSIVKFFLNTHSGLRVDERDSNNMTSLHWASKEGQLKLVQFLISKNADLDAQDFDGLTPLHYAADSGDKNVVELLLHNGAMYNAIDFEGKDVLQHISRSEITSLLASTEKLFEAVKENNCSKVEASLKDGAIINSKNRDGFTPLYYATIKGFNDIVDVLLKNKANPNAVNTNGFTALHFAVQKANTNVLRILLSNGAHVAQMTIKGNTALHIAALRNNIEIVEILLQHADRCGLNEFIDAKTTNSGSTALHVAAKNNSLDIIKALLKSGAACDATNQKGEFPSSVSNDQHVKFFLKQIEHLFGLIESGNSEAFSILATLDIDEFLAATKARNKEGLTLLQVAIINKRKTIAKQLVNILRIKR